MQRVKKGGEKGTAKLQTHQHLVAVLLVLNRLVRHVRLHVRHRNGVEARNGVRKVPALPPLCLKVAANRHRDMRDVAIDGAHLQKDWTRFGVILASRNLEKR
jgi:hypothetical protein